MILIKMLKKKKKKKKKKKNTTELIRKHTIINLIDENRNKTTYA